MPCQSASHTHAPSTHRPCPEQPTGHVSSRTEQSGAPAQPGAHKQRGAAASAAASAAAAARFAAAVADTVTSSTFVWAANATASAALACAAASSAALVRASEVWDGRHSPRPEHALWHSELTWQRSPQYPGSHSHVPSSEQLP